LTPVISIAKKPDRIIIPTRTLRLKKRLLPGETKTDDIFGVPRYHELKLSPDHYALKLLQQIRDESHRFSKKQHARMRTKDMFK
jgi:excinuclease UvrABC nuclease subunit